MAAPAAPFTHQGFGWSVGVAVLAGTHPELTAVNSFEFNDLTKAADSALPRAGAPGGHA